MATPGGRSFPRFANCCSVNRSPESNRRPRMTGMPIISKYPGVTIWVAAECAERRLTSFGRSHASLDVLLRLHVDMERELAGHLALRRRAVEKRAETRASAAEPISNGGGMARHLTHRQ